MNVKVGDKIVVRNVFGDLFNVSVDNIAHADYDWKGPAYPVGGDFWDTRMMQGWNSGIVEG